MGDKSKRKEWYSVRARAEEESEMKAALAFHHPSTIISRSIFFSSSTSPILKFYPKLNTNNKKNLTHQNQILHGSGSGSGSRSIRMMASSSSASLAEQARAPPALPLPPPPVDKANLSLPLIKYLCFFSLFLILIYKWCVVYDCVVPNNRNSR